MNSLAFAEKMIKSKVYYYYETENSVYCVTESAIQSFKFMIAGGGISYYMPVIKIVDKLSGEITEEKINWYSPIEKSIGFNFDLDKQKEVLKKFKPVSKAKSFSNYYLELKAIEKVIRMFE